MKEMHENEESDHYHADIAQLYRAEVQRTYSWRTRLDRTTNWAIIILAGLLTWAFSNPTRLHFVLLIGLFAITFLALIETRRYRTFVALNSSILKHARMLEFEVEAQPQPCSYKG